MHLLFMVERVLGLEVGALVDPTIDALSAGLFPIFNAINQAFFMSAFFLLAGYFTPRSWEKKGTKQFLKDRLIRLGIPIVIYTTILLNINEYMLDLLRGNPYHIPHQIRSGASLVPASIITLCDYLCNF